MSCGNHEAEIKYHAVEWISGVWAVGSVCLRCGRSLARIRLLSLTRRSVSDMAVPKGRREKKKEDGPQIRWYETVKGEFT